MPVKCEESRKAARTKYYEKNKSAIKARARAWTVVQARYLKTLVDRYKTWKGCSSCGYKKCAAALELHHLAEFEKDKHVGSMIHDGVSTARLKNEVRKCVVLCANCHREAHFPES